MLTGRAKSKVELNYGNLCAPLWFVLWAECECYATAAEQDSFDIIKVRSRHFDRVKKSEEIANKMRLRGHSEPLYVIHYDGYGRRRRLLCTIGTL